MAAAPAKKAKKNPFSKKYQISGGTIKKNNKACPKCGAGFLLANHSNRVVCGKCGFAEINKK